MKNLLKEYRKLEDNNDHNAAALLLVNNFGTKDEQEAIKNIAEKHEKRGHILHEEIQERYKISQKYYKYLVKA